MKLFDKHNQRHSIINSPTPFFIVIFIQKFFFYNNFIHFIKIFILTFFLFSKQWNSLWNTKQTRTKVKTLFSNFSKIKKLIPSFFFFHLQQKGTLQMANARHHSILHIYIFPFGGIWKCELGQTCDRKLHGIWAIICWINHFGMPPMLIIKCNSMDKTSKRKLYCKKKKNIFSI